MERKQEKETASEQVLSDEGWLAESPFVKPTTAWPCAIVIWYHQTPENQIVAAENSKDDFHISNAPF